MGIPEIHDDRRSDDMASADWPRAYAAKFTSQGIDWDVLSDLSEGDLKELGLTLAIASDLQKDLRL
jgi:hypothetical protein